MRLGVEPVAVTTAAGTLRDVGAQLATIDPGSFAALVSAGMPDTDSARLAVELGHRLAQDVATVAGDLTAYAERLSAAAEAYAVVESAMKNAVESAVTGPVVSESGHAP